MLVGAFVVEESSAGIEARASAPYYQLARSATTGTAGVGLVIKFCKAGRTVSASDRIWPRAIMVTISGGDALFFNRRSSGGTACLATGPMPPSAVAAQSRVNGSGDFSRISIKLGTADTAFEPRI